MIQLTMKQLASDLQFSLRKTQRIYKYLDLHYEKQGKKVIFYLSERLTNSIQLSKQYNIPPLLSIPDIAANFEHIYSSQLISYSNQTVHSIIKRLNLAVKINAKLYIYLSDLYNLRQNSQIHINKEDSNG